MANIQSKNMFHLNQIKLRNTHKISGNKTILKLEKRYIKDFYKRQSFYQQINLKNLKKTIVTL